MFILAAILRAMWAATAFLRFTLPMFPAASHEVAATLIFAVYVVAINYYTEGSAGAEDKGCSCWIAHSSVARMAS